MTKRKIRVALFEDNSQLRAIFDRVLTMRGYEVYCFETPAICPLQLCPKCRCTDQERCVDIILSDLQMPAMNGLDFIENQKRKNCKAPFVAMMSGNWGEEEIARATALGCKILHKPFKSFELIQWLDEVEENIQLDVPLSNWVNIPADPD